MFVAVDPIFVFDLLQNTAVFSEQNILTVLVGIFGGARALSDLSAENVLVIHFEVAFFDTDVVVDSVTVVVPDSESS